MTQPTRPGMAAAAAAKPCLQRRVAGAEHGQLRRPASSSVGSGRQQQVHALLPGQPADHAEQRARRRPAASPRRACSAALLRRAPRAGAASKRAGEQRIGRRVPDLVVDAVEDAAAARRARARSSPSSPMPPSGVRISAA